MIKGNSAFKRKDIIGLMKLNPKFLKKPPVYSQYLLKSDLNSIKRFYMDNGFLCVKAETESIVKDTVRKKVDITISINEGIPTIINTISINENTVDSSILRLLKCKPGTPMVQSMIKQDLKFLKESFRRKGYLKADVSVIQSTDTALNQADIEFVINKGKLITVDTVLIYGNKKLPSRIILRELSFHKGDTLTSDLIRKNEQRLYKTNLFRSVNIEFNDTDETSDKIYRNPQPQFLPMVVNVNEANFFKLKAGLGYGQNEGPRGQVETSYNNLFNHGHRLTLKGNVSLKMQQAMLVYTVPWFLGIPIRFDGSSYYNRFSNKDTYSGLFRGILLLFELNTALNATVQTWTKFEDVIWISSENLPDEYPLKNTQSFGIDLTYDTRNDLIDPYKGIYNLFKAEAAGITGINSNQFIKFTNTFRAYGEIYMFRLASGLKMGWVRPYGKSTSVPIQDKFFAGGSRSVRGFRDNFLLTKKDSVLRALSGTTLITANIMEVRFPLFWEIDGAVFTDAGILRNGGGFDLSVHEILNEIRWSAGGGLRLNTPLAILRFDLGFKLNRRPGEPLTQWHLDIGQSF